jgi:hypothetical protein
MDPLQGIADGAQFADIGCAVDDRLLGIGGAELSLSGAEIGIQRLNKIGRWAGIPKGWR